MSKKQPSRAAKSAFAAPPLPEAPASAEAQPPVIELEARMTIVQAAALHRRLSDCLAQARPIIIDGGRVEEIDTAILQLLTSLWRGGAERGIACTWHNVSAELRRSAALIGVDEMLGFPAVVPA